MDVARRRVLLWAAALSAAAARAHAADLGLRPADKAGQPAPRGPNGLDAAEFGIRPGSPNDQSALIQRAIVEAVRRQQPLALAGGVYRAGGLTLPRGAQVTGVRGATRLILTHAPFLMGAENADHVTLSGLVLDGAKRPLRDGRGLVHIDRVTELQIADCEILDAGGTAIACTGAHGEIRDTLIRGAWTAIHSLNARGLTIARNSVTDAGDNGIQVWRSEAGDDGTHVIDNRVSGIRNASGGSGQYGNGINVFRPAMSSSAATASRIAPSRQCAAMRPRASSSPATRSCPRAKSQFIANSVS